MKAGFFGKLTEGIDAAKAKVGSISQISDMCILKVRDILKQVDFDSVVKYIEQYKANKSKGLDKLKGEEKAKVEKKIKSIDSLIGFIGSLKKFAEGEEMVAPTAEVLDCAREIAAEKEIKPLVIIIQAIQIIMKISGTKEEKATSPEVETSLNSLITIACSDGEVTDEEMTMLKQQAEKENVSEEKLQQLIDEAIK